MSSPLTRNDREADGRPVLEPRDAGAHGREPAGERRFEPVRQPVARLDVFGRDHELREVRLLKLLVEGQIETRRAGADEIDHVVDFGSTVERLFEPFCLAQGGLERGAFRQAHVDEQFGPLRIREKLLRHARERGHRDREQHGGDAEHHQRRSMQAEIHPDSRR